MDEIRFSRLESRVDEIKNDVAEVKADTKILSHSINDLRDHVKNHNEIVKTHVAGDEKIITEIAPIIEEFKFEKERKRRRMASLKEWGMKLGIPATIVAIIGTILKVWLSF